jgi:glycosyltransferase involved in cell wall biosynthesis
MAHSILTTTWECHGKGVQFVKELAESVVSQTYRPIQWIVSDHSKDSAIEDFLKICDMKGIDFIYVRYSENYGNIGHNWNNALKYATGETIQYSCMDDRLAGPDVILDACNFMNATGAEWIACSHLREPSNTCFVPKWNPNIINANTISGPPAVILRSSLKDITMDPQFAYYVDCEWYYRIAKRAGPPVIFDSIVYINRIHDLQMTNKILADGTIIPLDESRLVEKYGYPLPTC